MEGYEIFSFISVRLVVIVLLLLSLLLYPIIRMISDYKKQTDEIVSPKVDSFVNTEISHIVKDIDDKEHANYIASKIRNRVYDCCNVYDNDDDDNERSDNVEDDYSSSKDTLLSIKQVRIRMSEKGENNRIVSLSALYFLKASILRGRLPVSVRITFYRKDRPLCYMDTIIQSLGKPIVLKEISKCLIYGEIYRVRIESRRTVFFDDFVLIDSPFPEMVPVLICQDAILLKCNYKTQTTTPFKAVEYNSKLFSGVYLTDFPKLLPTAGVQTGRDNILEPIPGKTSGHCLLYAKDPIRFDGSLSFFSDESDGTTNADLTLIKSSANPIEYYVLLKRDSPQPTRRTHANIKGWVINYRSSEGAEYKQIFSLSASIEKYYPRSQIEIRPNEKLRDITPEDTVTVWNTDEKIGVDKPETGTATAAETITVNGSKLFSRNAKDKGISFPKDSSFFQRDPHIVLDRETGECVMVTLGFHEDVALNPRWASSPCHFTSRDKLLVINPQRKHHLSPFVTSVRIYRGIPGGRSFTSQQGEALCSSVIVDRGDNLPSLHLPTISLPEERQRFCVHIQHKEPGTSRYSLIEHFPRSLPLETPLDVSSDRIYRIYTRIPSSGIASPTTANQTYANVGVINETDRPYSDLANILDDDAEGDGDDRAKHRERRTCTIFAIGLVNTYSDGTSIPDTIVKAIRSSLPEVVSITDINGTEVVRSKNIIVNNSSVLIILKNIQIDGSSQRWISSTPFGLGPCKTSGRCGILGNWVPLYTVDHVLPICKVFSYRYADDSTARGFTVYLSNTCANGRSVSESGISEIVALYLSPEIQGKRIVLNAVAINCNANGKDSNNSTDSKRTKIFSIPSKESIGGGAEGATSIIILDRVVYALMAVVITKDVERERRHFARNGLFTARSVTLSEEFVRRHRNVMN